MQQRPLLRLSSAHLRRPARRALSTLLAGSRLLGLSGLSLPPSPLPTVLDALLALHSGSAASLSSASPLDLRFPDPAAFVAAQLRSHSAAWREVLAAHPQREKLLRWVTTGVTIADFSQCFEGSVRGVGFVSGSIPPAERLPNLPSLRDHEEFVAKTIAAGVACGAMKVWGMVAGDNKVDPPHLCLPLGVEPSKPRLIYDGRYCNKWMHFPEFSYDVLQDLPRLVSQNPALSGAFALDFAQGYFHVPIAAEDQRFFGFEFKGVYYVYAVLPFGWAPSCFVFQTLSKAAVTFISSLLRTPVLAYLDDIFGPSPPGPEGRLGAYVTAVILMQLGYTLQLKKCCFLPQPVVPWLGFVVDFRRRLFSLQPAKLQKLRDLLQPVLVAGSVDPFLLERIIGKCSSFRLAAPGALLFVRHLQALLSSARSTGAQRGSRRFSAATLALTAGAVQEIQFWLTEVTLEASVRPWWRERHVRVAITSDSSGNFWGGSVDVPGPPGSGTEPLRLLCGGSWPPRELLPLHINVKEAKAGRQLGG